MPGGPNLRGRMLPIRDRLTYSSGLTKRKHWEEARSTYLELRWNPARKGRTPGDCNRERGIMNAGGRRSRGRRHSNARGATARALHSKPGRDVRKGSTFRGEVRNPAPCLYAIRVE